MTTLTTGQIFTLLSDFASNIGLVILFYQAFEWRIPRKQVRRVLCAVCVLGFFAYCIGISLVPEAGYSPFSLLCFTIPGLAADIAMAKYRDFRLVFTYCTIDVIGFSISLILRILFLVLPGYEWIMFLLTAGCYAGLNIFLKRIRETYWEVLKQMEKIWGLLSLVSIGFYLMLYVLIIYPMPIIERIEYGPVAILAAILTLGVCVVMFAALRSILQNQIYLSRLERQAIYEQYAYIDILTGLKNRRAYEEDTKKKVDRGEILGYALLDMNNLKRINDLEGHAKGDRALQDLSEYLLEYKECLDPYRVGGDEFALIAKSARTEEIAELFQMMQKKVEKEIPGISVAMGYGILENYRPEDVDPFMKQIDRNMYKRKNEMKRSWIE